MIALILIDNMFSGGIFNWSLTHISIKHCMVQDQMTNVDPGVMYPIMINFGNDVIKYQWLHTSDLMRFFIFSVNSYPGTGKTFPLIYSP
jgi:hypothetical protein